MEEMSYVFLFASFCALNVTFDIGLHVGVGGRREWRSRDYKFSRIYRISFFVTHGAPLKLLLLIFLEIIKVWFCIFKKEKSGFFKVFIKHLYRNFTKNTWSVLRTYHDIIKRYTVLLLNQVLIVYHLEMSCLISFWPWVFTGCRPCYMAYINKYERYNSWTFETLQNYQ